jgi:hypothetical protein
MRQAVIYPAILGRAKKNKKPGRKFSYIFLEAKNDTALPLSKDLERGSGGEV